MQRSCRSFHRNVTQRTFVTRFMRHIIFNRYINEFGTYLFIPNRVLHCVIWSKREKFGYITTKCTKETCIFVGNKVNFKKKIPSRKKIALELLHQRLGHISTRKFLAGDADNVWEDIELRIYPDPFCTLCQISSMNKRLGLKLH